MNDEGGTPAAPEGGGGTALGTQEGGGGGTALGTQEGGGESTAPTVPESYEDFTAPEGVELSDEMQEAFKGIAKENKWTQEQAAQAVAMHLKLQQDGGKAQDEAWNTQVTGWLDEAKKDKEFGGDAYDANIKTAVGAIEKFGTPELKNMLNSYGVGNHPELIRFAYRVGKAMQDDVVLGGKGGAGGEKTFGTIAKRLYTHGG